MIDLDKIEAAAKGSCVYLTVIAHDGTLIIKGDIKTDHDVVKAIFIKDDTVIEMVNEIRQFLLLKQYCC